MDNRCLNCEFSENCELFDAINFCEDCKDYHNCDICYETCEAGHQIECNNGFEVKSEYEEFEYEEDCDGSICD